MSAETFRQMMDFFITWQLQNVVMLPILALAVVALVIWIKTKKRK